MLQAYATQQAVLQMGHEAVTIQCLDPILYMTQPKFRYYLHKFMQADTVIRKLREVKSTAQLQARPEIRSKIKERDKMFNGFYQKNILLSPLCTNCAELTELASNFDAVIVGRNQLWNPVNIEHDYYTLTFVPDTVKRSHTQQVLVQQNYLNTSMR